MHEAPVSFLERSACAWSSAGHPAADAGARTDLLGRGSSAELTGIKAGIMWQDKIPPVCLTAREANLQHSLFSAVSLLWM